MTANEGIKEIIKETRSNACDKRYGFTIEQTTERIENLIKSARYDERILVLNETIRLMYERGATV